MSLSAVQSMSTARARRIKRRWMRRNTITV
nr:MAG TPA: hypothetical protein [Caudoviricetes sp.]DAL02810.1 MAG TPA: hypothetical protein [Caudoviricetes sp.]DAW18017.1 MAG TPA: hypothetical protein [Caudoviricetes sp.]DAW59865.1 MAG TPA: hypothetical protein [Caudoviricetes sp.]